MANNAAQADHLKRWDVALAAAETNAGEPGIDDIRFDLDEATTEARAAIARQASLKFQLQQTSRDLDAAMAAGKSAYSRLVLVVKGRYGLKSEKLVEYGIQPLRPAAKPKEPTPTLPEIRKNEMAKPPAPQQDQNEIAA